MDIIRRDTVYLGIETDRGIFRVGTLSKIYTDEGKELFEYDIDKERFTKSLQKTEVTSFPGFDEDNGWKQYHKRLPWFVEQRTFSSSRVDLEEILKPFDMKPEEYDRWELVKRSKGKYIDPWRLTTDINETY